MRWECKPMFPHAPRGAPVATSFPRLLLHHNKLLPPSCSARRSLIARLRARPRLLYAPLAPPCFWIPPSHLSFFLAATRANPYLFSGSPLRPQLSLAQRVEYEDSVRLVRCRGGDGGVLRGRGGAVRALRRGDPRRQQAGQQAPAPPARRARRQAPALRRLPGEGRLHLLRRGQGALLPRLRRAHPRPRNALGEPPALPRHGDPRRPRPRLRLRRPQRRPPRRRPPRPRAQDRLRPPALAGPARRPVAAAGPIAAPVPAAGLGRRRAAAVLRLRVQRQAAQGLASRLQGAGVVHRGHGAVPRPRAQGRQGHHGGPRVLRLAGGGRRRLLQDHQQSRRQRRRAPEQEGQGRDHRRRGLLYRTRSWLNCTPLGRLASRVILHYCCCIL